MPEDVPYPPPGYPGPGHQPSQHRPPQHQHQPPDPAPPPPPPPRPFAPPGSPGWDRPGGRILPLHPLTVGDVLDGSFRGLRAGFVPLAAVVLLFVAPLQLFTNLALSRVAPQAFGPSRFTFAPDPAMMENLGALVGVSMLAGIVSFVVELVVGVAVVILVLQLDRGEPADIGLAVRAGLRRSPTTIGASLLLLLVGIGALLLGALGAFAAVAIPFLGPVLLLVGLFAVGALLLALFSLVVPIAAVERGGPIATLGRVFWVMRVRFWRLIGITLLMAVVVGLATFAIALPFSLLAFVAGPAAWVVESTGQIVASVIRVPVMALAALLVYLDARIRFEGLDLELRTHRLPGPWTAR